MRHDLFGSGLMAAFTSIPFYTITDKVKRVCVLLVLLLVPLWMTSADAIDGDPMPDWFILLRDAVYEQNLSADDIVPLYRRAMERARIEFSGAGQYLMLSRCEYMLGRAYQYEERKNEAAGRYEAGIDWAEQALEVRASSEGWRMLAENISQSCAVRTVGWAMANGLKVEKYAKNALNLDAQNAAAQYMLAARWVYAPSPFGNYKRGIQMMEEIIGTNTMVMEKDDIFNVYSALGYA
jgi:tetratricopeptide (TPR) repeat protein